MCRMRGYRYSMKLTPDILVAWFVNANFGYSGTWFASQKLTLLR